MQNHCCFCIDKTYYSINTVKSVAFGVTKDDELKDQSDWKFLLGRRSVEFKITTTFFTRLFKRER